jgi:hypothetical protein
LFLVGLLLSFSVSIAPPMFSTYSLILTDAT